MRLVVGRTLGGLIRTDGPLDATRAVSIVSQVAAALDAAHTAGLIHRDVKPEDVLLTQNRLRNLADFGITASTAEPRLTSVGAAIGSFRYMAPERFEVAAPTPPVDMCVFAGARALRGACQATMLIRVVGFGVGGVGVYERAVEFGDGEGQGVLGVVRDPMGDGQRGVEFGVGV